jgi:hypothetical protein
MREGCIYERELGDGRELTVRPMIFTTRLSIGPAGEEYLDDGWCYEDPQAAVEAAKTWDGEGDPPVGWHRHVTSGRRRPGGDPTKEYVNQ